MNEHTNEPHWLKALKACLPLMISYLPIGIAAGILLKTGGFAIWMIVLVSLFVFSGGAQFLIASSIMTGTPVFTITLLLFFLELRYALLGTSLSKYLKNESKPFIFRFSFSMNDENYAVNYLKFSTDKKWSATDALMVEYFSLLSWTVGNIIGGLLGTKITIDLPIVHFALTAMFLYMVTMQLKRRILFVPVVISVVVSVLTVVMFKSTLGLIVATLVSATAGYFLERYLKANYSDSAMLKRIKNPRAREMEQLSEAEN
ncbi:AzlC family ABC transporter permease [Periweissella fabalis]|uniref:AzlC family ABC transporter permease n=1 Tax=Periweissella fabalis TaxID=1070421 RepID=A0A7X6N191_9LACO|nr:AzlC family ABC transporter permease [Periweissella fabalis]MCM0599576.1 AzlC family ABC transporter permease [Periweissella fabalis]NKZ23881.1 AzlC family ABC transporter permease [Periweissella fabalis]